VCDCVPVCLDLMRHKSETRSRAVASVPLQGRGYPMTGGMGRSANPWLWAAARDGVCLASVSTRLVAADMTAERSDIAYLLPATSSSLAGPVIQKPWFSSRTSSLRLSAWWC
jgi:hypothetical protein